MTIRCVHTGKVRYSDELGAKMALVSTRGSSSDKRRETRVYRCPRCNGWHLTSMARG